MEKPSSDPAANTPSDPAPSLMASVSDFASNGLGLLLSRIELATLELSELRDNLLKLSLVFALSLIMIFFVIAFAVALIVALSWDSLGWKILLILLLVFSALACGLLYYLRNMLKQGKLSLPSTMLALKTDRDMLLK
jgi:uncharacterized membrane protein YqjE